MTDNKDSKGLPAKYVTLKQAESAGLIVPQSLLLSGDHTDADIEQFLQPLTNSRFIVRSASVAEDNHDHSFAGHFWSSEAVAKSLVAETIIQAQQENQAVLYSLQSTSHPQLILQEYIEHNAGGVLFSPWSFFPDYAYIEYSEHGVKQVVEGNISNSSVLSLDEQYKDPLPLSNSLNHLKFGLVSLCHQLREVYDFPIDCEWVYDNQKQCVVVLQVRPQTHLVGPILPCPKTGSPPSNSWLDHGIDNAVTSLDSIHDWQFTALSESLGRLSPLSFSLLQQLYSDSIPTLQLLGCKAKSVDFMRYAPDGTVLVNPALEQAFYKPTLFGGFQRGKHQAAIQREAQLVMNEYKHSAPFSYGSLLQLFRYWMAANICSGGAGRESLDGHLSTETPHAYELAWVADLSIQRPANPTSWDELNRWGRVLFLFELNKFKREVRDENYKLFCTWSEYQSGDYQSTRSRQHRQAPYALYDYALMSYGTSDIQSLASSKVVEGPLYIVESPAGTHDIPVGCILVTPYFDNRWVGLIRHCKGIIVNRGSRLSHSAIVAREYDVPYYVMPELSLDSLENNQYMVLETNGLKP